MCLVCGEVGLKKEKPHWEENKKVKPFKNVKLKYKKKKLSFSFYLNFIVKNKLNTSVSL